MDKIKLVEATQITKEAPKFNVGDTVRVYVKIKEEDKIRLQAFEGTVIRKRGSGASATFTVRRVSYGEGIERIFPLYSPNVERIEIIKEGKVRRAKLYYLRNLVSKKKSKIEEKEEEILSEDGKADELSSPDAKI